MVESKSLSSYLDQMELMGEKRTDYKTIWGYSVNVTEDVMPLYRYPEFDFEPIKTYTNLGLNEEMAVNDLLENN